VEGLEKEGEEHKMTDITLFTIRDPKQIKMLDAALDSDYCINYKPILGGEDGKKVTSIEVVLDIEDEKVYKLLEALSQ
jgi:hypothetical protein